MKLMKKTSQSKQGKSKQPRLSDDQLVYSAMLSRGRILLWDPDDTVGVEIRGRHYWIIVSRDQINWDTIRPVIVVPMSSYEGKSVGASDVVIKGGDLPTGKEAIVRCGQIRAFDHQRFSFYERGGISAKWMAKIEQKLIETLGMNQTWVRRPHSESLD